MLPWSCGITDAFTSHCKGYNAMLPLGQKGITKNPKITIVSVLHFLEKKDVLCFLFYFSDLQKSHRIHAFMLEGNQCLHVLLNKNKSVKLLLCIVQLPKWLDTAVCTLTVTAI